MMSSQASGPENLGRKLRKSIDPIGSLLSDGFHFLGLFAIGAATVWAAAQAFIEMMSKGHATIEDLLLLFIYLEIGSMVGVYFKTNSMPLRFVIYVSITALTRHLIGFVNHATVPDIGVLILAGGILLLSLAVLVIRYASFYYGTSAGMTAAGQNLTDSEIEARNKAQARKNIPASGE